MHIYQIRDTTDGEVYYDVGHFSSLKKAKEQLVADNVHMLKNMGDGEPYVDYAYYEIHKIEINKIFCGHCLVFEKEFESTYVDNTDEYNWTEKSRRNIY